MVTGGAGFIGSHIVDALLARGHEVSVVDNLLTGKMENVHPSAIFLQTDICESALINFLQEQDPDYVIHHAAQINVRFSVDNPSDDARNNIMGTLNLLHCCQQLKIKGVIFASSGGAVYGETEQLPVKENHGKGPLSPYGVSKLSIEYYLYCFARAFSLPYIALRYANVYGPRQDADGESGVVALFGKKMLLGQTPEIFGDGEQIRDYVFVGDVVEANLLALEFMEYNHGRVKDLQPADPDYWAFNVASGKGTTVNELYENLQAITAYSGPLKYSSARPGELRRIFLDFDKARNILGWEPKVELKRGLAITLDDLKYDEAEV